MPSVEQDAKHRGGADSYVASKQEILARLQEPDAGRELATEFVQRRRLTVRELISVRRLPRRLVPAAAAR